MTRKILELNLYGESTYIDLNLVCVIGQIERYYPNSRAALSGRHCGFTIKLNISAPFSTNNEYTIYFGYAFEELKIDPLYPPIPPEKSPMVDKLYNKVVEIRNQMVDMWSGKTPGDNFVLHLSAKDLKT